MIYRLGVLFLLVLLLPSYVSATSEAQATTTVPVISYVQGSPVTFATHTEKNWVEFLLSRPIPMTKQRQMTNLHGIIQGIHSNWAYKQLEAAVDGIVDFKVDEVNGERKTFIGIRNMRNVAFDSRWHPLKIRDNSEITLET